MGTFDGRVSASNRDSEEITDTTVNNTGSTLDSGRDLIWMCWTGVTIPQAATIQSAYLECKSNGSDSAAASLRIRAEDVDSPGVAVESNGNLSGRAVTTAYVDYAPPLWVTGNIYTFTGLDAVIQEIVDRPGWASGNALALMIFDLGSSARRRIVSYDNDPSNAPRLVVTYADSAQTILAQVVAVPVVPLQATVTPGPVTIQAAVKQVPVVPLQAAVTEYVVVEAAVKQVPVVPLQATVTPGDVTIQAAFEQVPVVTNRASVSYGITAPPGVTVAGGGALVKIRSTDL